MTWNALLRIACILLVALAVATPAAADQPVAWSCVFPDTGEVSPLGNTPSDPNWDASVGKCTSAGGHPMPDV